MMDKMKRNMRIMLIVFTGMFVLLIGYTAYSVLVYGQRWSASPYNTRIAQYKKNIRPGDILDRNGEKLATTDKSGKRIYSKDEDTRLAVSHVVGDAKGMTLSGVESMKSADLYGLNNGVVESAYHTLISKNSKGSDIKLTIDAKLCEFAFDQLGKYDGAAVVMNYKTGEILASVSKPGYDPNTTDPASEGSEFVDRVLQGRYTPGSVFKIITAAAALKNIPGILDEEFTCKGEDDYKDIKVRDHDGEKHGKLDIEKAFAKSCNSTFGRIGVMLGAQTLALTAKEFGFGEDFLFDDVLLYSSRYDLPPEDELGHLAWSAAGQYKDVVTPMHMCLISACIANGGKMLEPSMVKSIIRINNIELNEVENHVIKQPLSEAQAETMKKFMAGVVSSGTGTGARVKGLKVCGKTGTAEISEDKSVKNHSWFTGFIDDEDHPLAIAIIMEKAGSGGSKSAPAAAKIFKKAVDLGY